MIKQLLPFDEQKLKSRTRSEILSCVRKLCLYYAQGILGGEKMPEDANPSLEKSSKDNFHYFTLPMALNYQRNSYKLWEAALHTYEDKTTRFVFIPEEVVGATETDLRLALLKHKIALQPNKHTKTWLVLCDTLVKHYRGDIRNLFILNKNDISLVLNEIQVNRKKEFPYLSGQKIANYWLYVILQYTSAQLKNKQCLSVAPDTHIIQSSIRLGVVEYNEDQNLLRSKVASKWEEILSGTELHPIDIHTPLWLWSRRNFTPDV